MIPATRFRAKVLVTPKIWISGDYFSRYDVEKKTIMHFVICHPYGRDSGRESMVRIDAKTLCQSTGLFDKNGKEIYAKDYLVCAGRRAQIHYSTNHACWFWGASRLTNHIAGTGAVNGDIFDDPELLEKGTKDAGK